MWSLRNERCIKCGTIEKKYYAKGMCRKCYNQYRKEFNRFEWSSRYERCIKCGIIEKKYAAKGLCRNCYMKEYYKNNSEKWTRIMKGCQKNNSEEWRIRIKEYQKKYQKKNSDKIKRYDREYRRNKRIIDLRYKLKGSVSNLINIRLSFRLSSKNGKSTWDFLPYSVDDLIQHLEGKFREGMGWSNHGKFGWHIDHIRPDCSFNYKSVEDEEFQKCWALDNLQPLWWKENLIKGSKIIN